MKPFVVHHRVDAFVMAFRVKLSPKSARELSDRGRLALHHGKVSINLAALDWELSYSRVPKRWSLVRKDHVRALIDLQAPGGKIEETGFQVHRLEGGSPERIRMPDGTETVVRPEPAHVVMPEYDREPGWTVELVFYAQYLAEHRLSDVVSEARDLANRIANQRDGGKVYEERIRRLDLCADVAGFEINDALLKRLVTRSRTTKHPLGAGAKAVGSELGDASSAGGGSSAGEFIDPISFHRSMKVAGLQIGCKDFIARIYDKPAELRSKPGSVIVPDDAATDGYKLVPKVEREEALWKEGGWTGAEPIARVEFELHGVPLREMGIHRADGIVEPLALETLLPKTAVEKWEAKPETMPAVTAHAYTLEEYLPRIWQTCIRWLRVIRPVRSRTGKLLQKTRSPLDRRWQILHDVKWRAPFPGDRQPIWRYRKRSHVSTAQAVGAMTSLVAAHGKLPQFPESAEAYKDRPLEKLYTMLRLVTGWGLEKIATDLVDRWGSAEEAAQHMAIRFNAARSRFPRAYEKPEPKEQGPPWQTDSIKHFFLVISEQIQSCGSRLPEPPFSN